MEYHPIANIFPLMEETEFEYLVDDIKKNGLHEPIYTYEGKILDGRNRYLACQKLGTTPDYIAYAGDDPLSYAISMNVARRHLTPSQRACLAVDLLPIYEEAAKQRQGSRTDITEKIQEGWGESATFAAEKLQVNPHYVYDAATVKEEAPELFDEMRAGLIHMKEAMREVKDNRRQSARAEMAEAGAGIPEADRWHVWQADIATWQAPHQYDFIITDPPYPKEYLPLYGVLAQRAKEWLKPTGLLIAMCGQSHLDEIYKLMGEHLTYYWTSCYLTPHQPTPLRQKQVNTSWKPLLVYSPSGEYSGKTFGDVYTSPQPGKDNHEWEQSEEGMLAIIRQVCLPGQYILDPFLGSGTTGIAALQFGCLFDGIDIDEKSVNISKARLNDATA